MSDQTAPLPAMAPDPEKRRGRWATIAVVASVVAVVLVAGGGFAAWRFLSGGGPRPAEVLPSSTFAVLSVDLDPSGGQKIEAIKTLRTFPTFREDTGIRPDSDVVKAIWDHTIGEECKKIDYSADVKPWIGERAAVGGVELDKGTPTPVVTVQVKDKDAAQKGFAEIAACAKASGEDDFGYTVGTDYAIVSDSTAHAEAIEAAGKKSPLSQDASYQKWTDKAGGPGIANGYASPRAVALIKDTFSGKLDSAGPGATKQLDDALGDFKGAGATLQFKDGGLELAVAGGGVEKVGQKNVGAHVGELPKDTAAVVAGAVDGKKIAASLDDALGGLGSVSGFFGGSTTDATDEIEQQTGLRLPGDLVTLLGDSFSISVGGDAPADLSDVKEPSDVPAGYLVRGDDTAVKDVVARLQQHLGIMLSDLPATFDTTQGKAVLATNPDYARQLLGKGSLGKDDTFKDVVPHADESPFVLFLSLDNDWSQAVAKTARDTGDKDDRELASDLGALKALGMSAWNDGSTGHALVRVTVK